MIYDGTIQYVLVINIKPKKQSMNIKMKMKLCSDAICNTMSIRISTLPACSKSKIKTP